MPKVSVIIPVYNVEKYLAECLDSAIRQTLHDIEIICINDGSTDHSAEILDEYVKKEPRMIVIHQKNSGPGPARNTGLDLARGEYTAFLDSDDIMKPTLCEKTVNTADLENADMTYFLYDTNHQHQKSKFERFVIKGKGNELTTEDLLANCFLWSKLWRTDFIQTGQLRFPTEIFGVEDGIFNWHSLSLNPKIAFVPERLLWYRVTPNSLTLNLQKGYFRNIAAVYDRIKENLLLVNKYNGQWKELFLKLKLHSIAARYNDVPKFEQPLMLAEIHESIGNDEREFLQNSNYLPWYVTDFYNALNGCKIAKFKCVINSILRRIKQTLYFQLANLKEKLRKTA
ncbi:MAG: glycosyltransferase [Planctomycetaceae bacterium]|jgi:glycosyltransferase involved in cell wall biosynthesis|nr:glycosyltransferase [Planctomycetaceae bacterium]